MCFSLPACCEWTLGVAACGTFWMWFFVWPEVRSSDIIRIWMLWICSFCYDRWMWIGHCYLCCPLALAFGAMLCWDFCCDLWRTKCDMNLMMIFGWWPCRIAHMVGMHGWLARCDRCRCSCRCTCDCIRMIVELDWSSDLILCIWAVCLNGFLDFLSGLSWSIARTIWIFVVYGGFGPNLFEFTSHSGSLAASSCWLHVRFWCIFVCLAGHVPFGESLWIICCASLYLWFFFECWSDLAARIW